MRSFYLDDYLLDDGQPPLFLPEIGTFFNKDIKIAKEMIMQLNQAGANIIKGEILHDIDMVLDGGLQEVYLSRNGEQINERYRDLIERKVVTLETYEEIFEHCKSCGMAFLLSVYDCQGAEFAKEIGACALKIASSNIVHRPLIEFVSKLDVPIIIDTGKSTIEEIARAMQWAEDAGAENIMIQHSPEASPSPIENHNMNMIKTFRQLFNRPVGLSDHYQGDEMLYTAIALGAHSIEKGVYPDGLKSEQDIHHAMPISKVSNVIKKCKQVYLSLGSGMRYLRRDREKYISRMGVSASRILKPGDCLTLDNVKFAFPADGIPVEQWEIIDGWKVRNEIPSGMPIDWSDVEPSSA